LSGNRTRISATLGVDVVSPTNGGWSTQYKRDLFGLETGRTFDGGMNSRTERDSLGRVVGHKFEKAAGI
jgi:hypothetical protein